MGCANSLPSHRERDDSMAKDLVASAYDQRILHALTKGATHSEPWNAYSTASDGPASFLKASLPHVSSKGHARRNPDPDRTVIIIDWDDALCPSSWARQNGVAGGGGQDNPRQNPGLKKLSSEVCSLLNTASLQGKVFIVTNVSRSWVDFSCGLLLPQAQELLRKVPVICGMKLLSDIDTTGYSGPALRAEAKHRAIQAALEAAAVSSGRFPNQNQTVNNIVSIGCAPHVLDAEKRGELHEGQSSVTAQTVFTKMIKLRENPSVSEIASQLSLVARWLPKVARAEENVEIDFCAMDDTLARWHALYVNCAKT